MVISYPSVSDELMDFIIPQASASPGQSDDVIMRGSSASDAARSPDKQVTRPDSNTARSLLVQPKKIREVPVCESYAVRGTVKYGI